MQLRLEELELEVRERLREWQLPRKVVLEEEVELGEHLLWFFSFRRFVRPHLFVEWWGSGDTDWL